jgi:hypothetical protein
MEVRTTTGDTDSSASEEHFKRQFLFVPGVCNRNNKSSHSHVQVEYRRQQRWQKTRQWDLRKSVPKGWIDLSRLPTRSNLSDSSMASSSESTRLVLGQSVPTASKLDSDEEPVPPKNSAKVPIPKLANVYPKTRPSQHSLLAPTERYVTSFEPFGSFPVTLNRDGMALVHHCKPNTCASSFSSPQQQPDSEISNSSSRAPINIVPSRQRCSFCVSEKHFPSTCNGE